MVGTSEFRPLLRIHPPLQSARPVPARRLARILPEILRFDRGSERHGSLPILQKLDPLGRPVRQQRAAPEHADHRPLYLQRQPTYQDVDLDKKTLRLVRRKGDRLHGGHAEQRHSDGRRLHAPVADRLRGPLLVRGANHRRRQLRKVRSVRRVSGRSLPSGRNHSGKGTPSIRCCSVSTAREKTFLRFCATVSSRT